LPISDKRVTWRELYVLQTQVAIAATVGIYANRVPGRLASLWHLALAAFAQPVGAASDGRLLWVQHPGRGHEQRNLSCVSKTVASAYRSTSGVYQFLFGVGHRPQPTHHGRARPNGAAFAGIGCAAARPGTRD